MIDISAAREGFRDKLISDIIFVADGLTKEISQAALQQVVSISKLSFTWSSRPHHWIPTQ